MDDRQPKYPGRVRLVPVEGQEGVYDMTMADEPTNAGDAPIKKNLLQDDTAEMLGLTKKAVVNDALSVIAQSLKLITSGSAVLNLTVVDDSGLPVKGVMVSGLFDAAGGQMYTDDNGKANGIIAANGATISISGYMDLQDYSENINITQGATEIKTITLTRVTSRTINSSTALNFSKNVVTFDMCLCGAGGGSGYATYVGSSNYRGSAGGGGGYVINLYGLDPNSGDYNLVVGVGGRGGNQNTNTNATAGGYTQLTKGGESVGIAMGGAASPNGANSGAIGIVDGKVGPGNGPGGSGILSGTVPTYAKNGSSGTTRVFDDPSGELPGGGGAGGGYASVSSNMAHGGSSYGGDGDQNGQTPGGGAGGRDPTTYERYYGFNGGNGRAWIRMVVA